MNFKQLLVIAFCLVISNLLIAVPQGEYYQELFEAGNDAYKAGNYDSAKSCYAEIHNNGIASAELFYNLANAFFKSNNIPAAILYYERALLLSPDDKDIAYNLEVANSYVPDKIEPLEPFFLDAWTQRLAQSMAPNAWVYLFWTLLVLLCLLVVLFFAVRKPAVRQVSFLTGILLLLISSGCFWMALESKLMYEKPYAIVFSPSVNVKSEPALNATVQFVIHEGLKVELLDAEDDWFRIQLTDGKTGWVPAQSIEPVQWSKN